MLCLGSSGFSTLDKLLGHDGYPDRSAVLAVGPPGIGKEALGYKFAYDGLALNEFCIYASALSTRDILQDMQAFGIDTSQKVPFWFASSGGQVQFNPNDLAALSFNIKEVMRKNSDRKIRVVIDSFSSLLMTSTPETLYKFLGQLIAEVKNYDATLFGTLEEGMHPPQVLAAMQLLFDGVIELRFYEEGLRLLPLLRIKKMRGAPPEAGYYRFSISRSGMEISAYVK